MLDEVLAEAPPIPTPGIYRDVPASDYHDRAKWPFYSRSDLSLVLRSPAHWKAAQDNPPEPTPAMRFGTLCHTVVLEPDRLWIENVVPPKWDARKPEGKKIRDAFQAEQEANPRNIVTDADVERAQRIAEAVWKDEYTRHVLGLGEREVSYVWQHPPTGLTCRCRTDVVAGDCNLLADFKTAADAQPEAFSKAIYNNGLHRQAAWYLDGVNAAHGETVVDRFLFVVAEKEPPFACGVYVLDKEDIERGRVQNEAAIRKLAYCLENDEWPGYANNITPIGIPRWARRELDKGLPHN